MNRGIEIDPTAVQRIKILLAARQTPQAALRISVLGGGCAGLRYQMDWSDIPPKEKDKQFQQDSVTVLVDPKSYLYLMGTRLEYQETLMESGFKLVNPNATTSCGCGTSFSA